MSKEGAIAQKAAKAGGLALKKFFGKKIALSMREDDSFSSSATVSGEKKALEAIHRAFPAHSVLSTEAGAMENDAYHRWLLDPCDEPVLLMRANPAVGVAVAFERRSQLEAAVVYFPFWNQLFFAERGKGATLNGKKIRVSAVVELEQSFVLFDDFRAFIRRNHVPQLELLIKRSQKATSGYGKLASLMAVARGDVDLCVGSKISPGTLAAARLIVTEAGGQVSDYNGKATHYTSNFIASNQKLHEAALSFFGRHNSMNL